MRSPGRPWNACTWHSGSDDLFEARELMDRLNNLSPATFQSLLEACTSIKVKRLFLYVAGHEWVKHVDRSGIDLGSGSRNLVSHGTDLLPSEGVCHRERFRPRPRECRQFHPLSEPHLLS
ncbi:type IV toxin-antitoxin system AbiEi family antitoxin domain-containing protein [Neomesorhizobium albiziae]